MHISLVHPPWKGRAKGHNSWSPLIKPPHSSHVFQFLRSRKYFSSSWAAHYWKASHLTGLQTKTSHSAGLTARHRSQPFHSQIKQTVLITSGEDNFLLKPSEETFIWHINQVSSKHSSQLGIYHFPLKDIFSDHEIKAVRYVHAKCRSESSMEEWLSLTTVSLLHMEKQASKKNAPTDLSRVVLNTHVAGHAAQGFTQANYTRSI